MRNISIIVAMAQNRAIGKNNQLLWHLPADLKHFKQLTIGHTIIMGRKTFDSIAKPLPNRRNIIITRQKSLEIPGAEIANSLEQALELCKKDEEIFIIGGAQIYEQALPLTSKIYLTTVKQDFEADAFFPYISPNNWNELDCETYQPDEKNAFGYTFTTLAAR